MRLILKKFGILAILLVSQNLFASHFTNVRDSLNIIIDNKKAKLTDRLSALDQLINFQYLSNDYDNLKSSIDNAYRLSNRSEDSCTYLKYALWEAKYYKSIKEDQKALTFSKSILQSAQNNQCSESEISILLFQAKLLLRHKNPDTCLTTIKKARFLAEEIGDKFLIARTHNMEGIYHLINNNFEESRLKIKQALEEYLHHDKAAHIGKSYSDIAYTFYLQSAYDSAIIFNTKAIPLLEKAYSLRDIVTNYNNLALNYQNTGKMNEAIDTYFKGLKIADELDFKEDRIIILYNLGNCYYSLDAKDKAFENFKLCQLLAINDKDTLSIIYSSNAIGSIAVENKQLDTASKYLNLSYKYSKIAGDSYTLMFGANGLASLEIEKNNLTEAQSFLDKSYEYATKMNNPDDLININIIQAELYSKQKNHTLAINLLLKTYNNALTINSLDGARFVLASLSEAYENSGDFSNALIYSKKEKQYQDSINSSSILENLVTLENKFEQEKVDKIKALEQANSELERAAELRKAKFTTIIFIISTLTFFIISWLLFRLSKDRKRRNAELNEHNKFIEDHRDELKNIIEELKTTTENLDNANNTKSKLLSIIGHDLRNPFNIIQGYIQLLTEDNPDSETRQDYYQRINTASDNLLGMVDNLLIWSRNQSDKIKFSPIRTNLNELFNESLGNLKGSADLKEISLSLESSSKKDFFILLDPDMINRVIHNLLVNAIKFTASGGKVSLGFRIQNNILKVWVKDTGIGMNPEEAANIFNYSQIKIKNGTDGEKGTGLGLSICSDFIEAHKGKIWVESKLNKGSIIFFEIPV